MIPVAAATSSCNSSRRMRTTQVKLTGKRRFVSPVSAAGPPPPRAARLYKLVSLASEAARLYTPVSRRDVWGRSSPEYPARPWRLDAARHVFEPPDQAFQNRAGSSTCPAARIAHAHTHTHTHTHPASAPPREAFRSAQLSVKPRRLSRARRSPFLQKYIYARLQSRRIGRDHPRARRRKSPPLGASFATKRGSYYHISLACRKGAGDSRSPCPGFRVTRAAKGVKPWPAGAPPSLSRRRPRRRGHRRHTGIRRGRPARKS